MIPLAHIQQWTAHAPWPDLRQVEQDLIICRALCDLFNSELIRGKIAFRGGTAINKLLFGKPLRYSEDIELVQTQQEPVGGIIDAIRDALSWLGNCNRTQTQHSMHLTFKFTPESGGRGPLKLKVEINMREHQNLHGLKAYPFEIASDWHQAKAEIASFEPSCKPAHLSLYGEGERFGAKIREVHDTPHLGGLLKVTTAERLEFVAARQ